MRERQHLMAAFGSRSRVFYSEDTPCPGATYGDLAEEIFGIEVPPDSLIVVNNDGGAFAIGGVCARLRSVITRALGARCSSIVISHSAKSGLKNTTPRIEVYGS